MLDTIDRATLAVRSRWKFAHVAEAALLLLAVIAGGAFLLFALDNLIHFSPALRVILAAALLLAAGGIWTKFFLMPLLHPVTRDEAVILIERSAPELDNRLINAERLRRSGNVPRDILEMIQAEASEMVARLDLRRTIP